VLSDQFGELMTPVVQTGRIDRGMPKFDLTNAQVADIAAFVHSARAAGREASGDRPPDIAGGDAQAGELAFKARCAGCHSVTGDLKGFGGRFVDAGQLQQKWLMPALAGGRGDTPKADTHDPPQSHRDLLPKYTDKEIHDITAYLMTVK
jgi:mono/diheme cytochrome c family protein